MRKKYLRKVFVILLAAVLTVGICMWASASVVPGDVNGDGKVTVLDAQLLAEANAGLRQLNKDQQLSATRLTVRDIVDAVLGKALPPSVQAGDTFLSAQLAPADVNGENGMTYFYTSDGKTLTPFSGFAPQTHEGRWYHSQDDALLSFVDPFVNTQDNYGWIGMSEKTYVVVGYEMPAAGQIRMTNWLALHTGHDCRILIAQGTPDNIVDVCDVIGGVDHALEDTAVLTVEQGQMVYVLYQPLETAAVADQCYVGYKTQYTYLQVGQTQAGTTQTGEQIQNGINSAVTTLSEGAGLAALAMDVTLKPIGTRQQVYTYAAYADGVATFTYTDGQTTVDYVIDTGWDKVQKGLVEVQTRRNGGQLTQAVTNAGTGYRTTLNKVLSPAEFADKAQVTLTPSFDEATGHLYLDYTEVYQSVTTQKRYDICLDQKSLVVHVTSPDQNGLGGYADFRAGSSAGLTNPAIENSIYVEEVSVTVVDSQWFLSAYLDKAKTFATLVENVPACYSTGTDHGMTAHYERNSKGQTNPMHEVFYVTASDSFLDCVYLTNGQKSQYRDVLNELVVYDNWQYNNSYTDRKEYYVNLVEQYGLTDVLLVEHRWQRDTLDVSNPAHYPASTEWGSAEAFADYIGTVKAKGWTLALHEDYWFMQPSDANQYWNVDNVRDLIAQNADGSLRYGWQDTSYANKSDMMAVYAQQESPRIENAYDPGASFLDVNGGVDPSDMNQVTLNGDSTTSRTLAQVVADNAALFCQQRQTYGGPVISEGAQGDRSFGSAYAGFLDSSSREITDCYDCRIMPDYELTYIRPLMANQGMGPLARFQPDQSSDIYDFDKYNATCIAYGHAGFIGEVHYSLPLQQEQMINTYYMFRAIQSQYLDSSVNVEAIRYYDTAGNVMGLDAAVKGGYDFTAARLYIRYSNGLEIYLNFSSTNWNVTLNGHSYMLDKNGYCAENPSLDFVQYSCLRSGVRVDYVSCREYTYANPRGSVMDFGNGLVGNLMMVRSENVTINGNNTFQTAPIQFTALATAGNGDQGLTFYYTEDGKTLYPYRNYDASMGRWYDNANNQLNFVDPREVVADNYGLGQTSASRYVVMEYTAPSTGTVELYVWTANQNGSGYQVSVALDTPDNVIGSYQAVTAGTADLERFVTSVYEGQQIYFIYKPLKPANGEWFGYITSVTYQ